MDRIDKVNIGGKDAAVCSLQRLFRTCVLKISGAEFEELSGIRTPNLLAHESGRRTTSTVDTAFSALGFWKWIERIASATDAGIIHEMLSDDSWLGYMSGSQVGIVSARRGG